ncbi:antibiotic biosynthesis monooxygenase family protein [Chryseobacterium sp. YIM B08800]|uniref:antibiotic biosynthesis monooxygenase family protein n=1 Tax=Chryseobacterium sp. YIM B08800 TaxID=2984136 RepID=UPI00223FDAE7|nr:antibiotic biosynthesis monooxygenase [Chryseobacterium sp. YIM B08800]
MIAVIFEVWINESKKSEYLDIAAALKKELKNIEGFISIERFQSLSDDQKILSLSFWENENAISEWRNFEQHKSAQQKGRSSIFNDYKIRVGNIVRNYGFYDRKECPFR